MAVQVETIKERLALALATGLDAPAVPYLPDNLSPGVAGLFAILDDDDTVVERATMGGATALDTVFVTVRCYLSRTDPRSSTLLADRYRTSEGPGSVRAIIHGDRTLGGVAQYTIVREPGGLAEAIVGETSYLAVDWPVEVLA